jgi:large subunit ribosomal protein L17
VEQVAEEVSEQTVDVATEAPEGSHRHDEALDAAEPAEESANSADAPYGEGSHAPLDDPQQAPEGFDIKGNADSMLYHVPGSSSYDRTVAEVWFATPEAAEAAGFALPASQRKDSGSPDHRAGPRRARRPSGRWARPRSGARADRAVPARRRL